MMTDVVQIELIRGTFTGIPSIIAAYFAYKSSAASHRTEKISKNIEMQTDGLTDQLVAINRKDAEAEGNIKGRAEQKKEGIQL